MNNTEQTATNFLQIQEHLQPQQPTMADLNDKLDRLLAAVEELAQAVDALDIRVSEIGLDYGTGFGIEE